MMVHAGPYLCDDIETLVCDLSDCPSDDGGDVEYQMDAICRVIIYMLPRKVLFI